MSGDKVNIQLGRNEALVLFELLADFNIHSNLESLSPADRIALIYLHGQLEKTLVEPLRPEYLQLLDAARADLIKRLGTVE